MSRDLSAALNTALDEDQIVPAHFAWFDFDGDPVYAWTGNHDITWDPGDGLGSQTWVGLQGAVRFDWFQETSDPSISSAKATLAYVPEDTLPDLISAVYKERDAVIYLVLFDKDDPGAGPLGGAEIFSGTMDTMSVNVGDGYSIVDVVVANQLIRLKQSWGAIYTAADQEALFTGDTALRFMPSMQDVRIQL